MGNKPNFNFQKLIKMGNIDSYGYDPTKQTKLIQTHPQYEVYQSQLGQQYQRYLFTHIGKQSFEQQCSYRINQKHDDFIQVLYVGRSNSLISCRNKDKYQVITERIPYRLNSLTSISFSNSLTILKCSLRGFGDLFTKYGAFNINQKMIGFNKRNKVKVWINSNYALNCPQEVVSFSELSPKYQERQMVHGVFDLINSKTKASQWSELMYLKEINNPCNFGEALAFVQHFCRQRQFDLNASKQNISNIYRYNYSKDKIKQNEQVNKINKSNPQYFLNKPAFKQPLVIHRQNISMIVNEPLPTSKDAQVAVSYSFPATSYKQIIRYPPLQSNHINVIEIKPKLIYMDQKNIELQVKKTANQKKTIQFYQQTLFKENDDLNKQISPNSQRQVNEQCINNPRQNQKQQERSESLHSQNNKNFLQPQQSIEEQIKLQQIKELSKRQILLQVINQKSQKGQQLQKQENQKNSLIQAGNKFETQKPTIQTKICNQLNQWGSFENIRGSINVSLVDTRQIKRKSIDYQEESRNQWQITQKPKIVSYRQIRRMLLQQLQA